MKNRINLDENKSFSKEDKSADVKKDLLLNFKLSLPVFYKKYRPLYRLIKLKSKQKLKMIKFVSKQELKETYLLIKLLKKKNRTAEEVEFIKEQLKDLGRMGIIGTAGALPGGSILLIVLYKLGLKLLPSAYDDFNSK